MLTKTEGIVLHSIKQGESGRIVKIFTKSRGLIPLYLRATVSKKKGNTNALYQSLMILDLELDIRESRTLQTIRSAQSSEHLHQIYSSPIRSSIALFMAELFLNCLEEEEESIILYSRLRAWTQRLEVADDLSEFPILYMIDLTDPLGFYPHSETQGEFFDLREGIFSISPPLHMDFLAPEISSSLRTYLGTGFVADTSRSVNREMRRRLMEGLILYYKIHVPQFKGLSSFRVLSEVFSI